MEKELQIGDEVVEFRYWNASPDSFGVVTRLTEHFAEIEEAGFLSKSHRWVSRANIEKCLNPAPKEKETPPSESTLN